MGGYLYSATQIPYNDEVFSAISWNRPKPLSLTEDAQHKLWILGLPGGEGVSPALRSGWLRPQGAGETPALPATPSSAPISWNELQPLMHQDSRVREILQTLKQQQERELSDVLAQLNAASVNGTSMRRHALDKRNIDDLLKENAISQARYHTLLETWNLLDNDEQAFKKRQADERFNALLGLLTDDKVDESHKIEFIDFMVRRFAGDVRLVQPLIHIYADLDAEYPRQKRLNQDFLGLYLAKRDAVLRGLSRIGAQALQPLLDYRRKTISHVTYSQAKLDDFLQTRFNVSVRPLYGVAEARSIPDFLNRDKYPPLQKSAGASFEQEYIRRGLLKLASENAPPQAGTALMGLSGAHYEEIRSLLRQGYSDGLDYLLIDPNPVVRANLAWQLAEWKNPYSLPLIFELMRDQNPEVRRLAAIAVGNFALLDTQGSNDPKFTEIVRMLQNYRSDSDAFGRAYAVIALAGVADKQKALYLIDLILNDGDSGWSMLGDAAPAWQDDAEKAAVQSLIATLQHTPEELSVKTQALNALIAIDTPESLSVLLHYLNHVYDVHHSRPSLWRYIVPHMTLPQEAENIEDVVFYMAQTHGKAHPQFHKRHLKALNVFLRSAYEESRSGEFFQLLGFLQAFDGGEYADYLAHTGEQIRIMRAVEYFKATYAFWLAFWPLSLLGLLSINYVIFPLLNLDLAPARHKTPNRRANPAADAHHIHTAPSSVIVPIKISSKAG